MQYRRLGRAGVKVSEIALGSWITPGGEDGRRTAVEIHLKAFELGINFFDTADVYARGESERIVGDALAQLKRSDIVVATKCCGGMGDSPNDSGLSRKHIVEACEASLKRLKTDTIDLYQFHRPDAGTPIDETISAVGQLQRQGKVLYWGLSNFSAVQTYDMIQCARGLGIEQPVSHQPRYNLFAREIETDLVPLCEREGLGFVVYSPLSQGLLTGKYKSRDDVPADSRFASRENAANAYLVDYNFHAIEKLRAVAEESGITLVQLSLAWILRQKSLSATIVGASKIEQIESNASASGVKLSGDVLEAIERILKRRWAQIKIKDHERELEETA